jgi:hypothetical protein
VMSSCRMALRLSRLCPLIARLIFEQLIDRTGLDVIPLRPPVSPTILESFINIFRDFLTD